MNEVNSIEMLNKYSNLSDQTKFRLNVIIKIEDYFNSEIEERKSMSKKLGKYIAAFDYTDRTLIALSATSGGVFIISLASVTRIPAWIASASFTLVFPLTTVIINKLLSITRNKKKHNKIAMLAKSKLNSIETLILQASLDFEINHEEFKAIVNENEKYQKMNEDIRMIKCSNELNKENGKKN